MSALLEDVPADWYVDAYDTIAMAFASVTEDAEADVDRVLRILEPPAGARVLDLACGAGNHAIELARRGFGVLGVDLAEEQLEMAHTVVEAQSEEEYRRLDLRYLRADVRELELPAEFDLVLNLHGGAVGFFADDAENRRTFETIAACLRPGGRTLMQLPNVRHAEAHLPAKTWKAGKWTIELLDQHWNPDERCVEGTITPIVLDDPEPMRRLPFRQRLYSVEELFELFRSVDMSLEAVLDADGAPAELSDATREIFVVASRD